MTATTPAPQKGKLALPIVMLSLAVLLAIVGVYVFTRPPARITDTSNKPTDAQLVIEKSNALMKDGLYNAAINLLTAQYKADPKDPDVRLLLAEALMATKQYAQAETVVDSLWTDAPLRARLWWMKGELTRRRGQPAKSYMTFFKSATDQPDATPEIWSKYGQVLLEHGEPLEARTWCQKAYAAGLRDTQTIAVLGELALKNDELPRAQELLEQALKQDKNDPRLWRMLVQTHRRANRPDQAIEVAQQALQGRPDGGLLLELGELLEAKGDKAKAADAYAAAADYRSVQAQASAVAAKLFYELGGYARAMRYADQAAALLGDDPALKDLQKKIEDARFGKVAP